MDPLRILHVLTHNQVTRGGAIQALLLAHRQLEAGHHVEVVCHRDAAKPLHETFARWRDLGLDVHPFHQNRPRELLRFRRFLRERRPDVVHAHREKAAMFVWLATALNPVPAFVVQRGTTHPIHTWYHGIALRSPRTHRIVAVAEAVKRQLVGEGVDARKVEVVYGSFDVERFDPATADRGKLRRELGLGADDRLVVQVGELHPKKSPRIFIRMAARLTADRPNVACALVGKGRREEECRREIEKLGVGDRVRLLGFRDDVPDVYAAADVAVNCSKRFEGLTGALREALAMEKPVAATATDGNPEVVRHGETGLLVPVDDVEAMAAAVGRLLDHEDEARAFGRAGRRLVLENMHPEVRHRRVIEVYRAVLSEHGAPAAAPEGVSS